MSITLVQAAQLGLIAFQALVVIGGGFYIFGRLGAKIEELARAVDRLATAEERLRAEYGGRLNQLEANLAALRARFER